MYVLRMTILVEFVGGFITFLRGREERIERNQSIIGDIPVLSSPNTVAASDRLLT